jgi:hypothetical protein
MDRGDWGSYAAGLMAGALVAAEITGHLARWVRWLVSRR